jgi:SPP1 gp7 family putative phage head morphogenesis protein
MEDIAKAIVEENVSLIKSIPQQYFKDITGSVMRSITTGAGMSTLLPQIQKYNAMTERRAKNLALDQTRKAYNGINKQRMQSIGVKKFEWVHSGGGQHPRRSHIALGGRVFSFDDLPVINKEQVDAGYEGPVRGIPGQAINCRCTMIPVIEFDDIEQE